MRRLIAATYVVAVVSSACSGSGDVTTTAGDEPAATAVTFAIDRQQIDRFATQMDYLREQLRIPAMSVAVVQDQELVWAEGFGYADLRGEVPARCTSTTATGMGS